VGLALGFPLGYAAIEGFDFGLDYLYGPPWHAVMVFGMFGAVEGASVGMAQWLILRRWVSHAGWWVLASTVGLAVGFPLYFSDGEAVSTAVASVAVGAITGRVLVWLLRQPASKEIGPR
jgi:hypothetical protein